MADNFSVVHSNLFVSGGTISGTTYVYGGQVEARGGMINSVSLNGHATMRILDGTTSSIDMQNSRLLIEGGNAGFVTPRQSSEVILLSGQIGPNFLIFDDSVANILGGTVGLSPRLVNAGSTINISGGTVGTGSSLDTLDVAMGSIVNLSGGIVSSDVQALDNSTFNIFGTKFVYDGVDITSTLTEDIPTLFSMRGKKLSGKLADGRSFDFLLTTTTGALDEYFLAAHARGSESCLGQSRRLQR